MPTTQVLEYPFDIKQILLKRKALRAQLLEQRGLVDVRIAILGGSTTAEIRSIAELFLLYEGFRPEFLESEYGKYFEDVAVDSSALRAFRPQIAFVHTTQVNLVHAPALFASEQEVEKCIAAEIARYQEMWTILTGELGCVVVQNNFDLPPARSLGSLDSTECFGRTHCVLRLNLEFARAARANPKLIINDIHHLSARLGLDSWFDPDYWFSYKMAVSHTGTVHLAHALTRLIGAALGRTRKCLVLDLDNTLWGGVVGDDGVAGLKIGNETPQGEAFAAFQRHCRELRQRGILLAACSKNGHDSAVEGFTHPDTVLKRDDFSAFHANWEPKSTNVERIAADLNVGLDALVFVDDNPVEREIVRAQVPGVAVPEIGAEVSRFPEFLDRAGWFEAARLSRDDAQRADYYTDNAQRVVHAARFSSYAEFLASLDMKAEIGPFSDTYLDRICQLTNKTNQFNLTTRRFTLAELEAMARSAEHVTLYGRLADRFGDNGLVTVLAGRLADTQLHVDLWLMSCRVLKRDLEYAMLDALAARAMARGANEIIGYYVRTARNDMVADHYGRLGFERIPGPQEGSGTVWRLRLSGYESRNRSIREIVYV